ncbi:MAG TPA: aldo/keto reductase [Candidatus Limnocylindrales bacterium]|jgi:aryl-alcohol dehydrogenase-like predicted oxidoreductase
MRVRSLGKSDLPVSEMGLGLAAIGRPGYINLGREQDLGPDRSVEAFRQRAHDLLDAAYAGGVRYVDAARSYGLAEEFLGSWLDHRAFPPGHITVGSKWGYRYTADWRVGAEVNEIKDHSVANLKRQLAESRALLGDRLRLYQIHSATLESGVLVDREVLDELRRLGDGGLAIGLTVSGPHQSDVVRRALEIRIDGRSPFASVQATWNLLEPSVGPALAEAKQAGWGVIVKEALANGRLTSRAPQSTPAPLASFLRRLELTEDAVALAAAIAQPWSDVVLSGAVTPGQLSSNLSALDLVLSPDDLSELTSLSEQPERYWATRASLAWT